MTYDIMFLLSPMLVLFIFSGIGMTD